MKALLTHCKAFLQHIMYFLLEDQFQMCCKKAEERRAQAVALEQEMLARVQEESEVHFLPAIGGGTA